MIEVKNLSCSLGGKKILKELSFRLEEKRMLGILGPNGSGKTTLLRHLTGNIKSKQTVFFEQQPLESIARKDLARLLSFVPQKDHILEEFSLWDFVSMGRYPYKKLFHAYGKEDEERVREALEIFSLKEQAKLSLNRLSGGELKRAFLARAFVQDTKILILDEPNNHLDIKYQRDLMQRLRRMEDKTRICSMHDMNMALEFCDDILLLKEGTLVSYGKTEEVLKAENIEKVFDVKVRILEEEGRQYFVYE